MNWTTRDTCRVCGDELESVLDLGVPAISTFVKNKDRIPWDAPLEMVRCKKCNLHQLRESVRVDLMYRNYWYRSNLNNSMLRDLKDVIDSAELIVPLDRGDIVVDIGCNDGSMFDFYTVPDLHKLGYDPALNLGDEARKHCTWFVNDYFTAEKFPYAEEKAKIITAIAMFYDLEDPVSFLKDVVKILDDDGIFIIQLTDLYSMYKTNAFDNICHEHLEYYSLDNVLTIFNLAGLQVFRVSRNAVNGGSIRVYACKPFAYEIDRSVLIELEKERNYFSSPEGSTEAFRSRIETIKTKIVGFIKKVTSEGKSVYVLGASTKGNTLLQYFELDSSIIPYAAEVNKDKFGLYTVSTNIEIIPESEAVKKHPDYFLVLPWHFANNLIEKHYEYFSAGGSFILPMPKPVVVNIKKGWDYL